MGEERGAGGLEWRAGVMKIGLSAERQIGRSHALPKIRDRVRSTTL